MSPPKKPLKKATRLHDFRSAYANFLFLVNLLKTGRKVEAQDLPAVIIQLEKALETLKNEIAILEVQESARRRP